MGKESKSKADELGTELAQFNIPKLTTAPVTLSTEEHRIGLQELELTAAELAGTLKADPGEQTPKELEDAVKDAEKELLTTEQERLRLENSFETYSSELRERLKNEALFRTLVDTFFKKDKELQDLRKHKDKSDNLAQRQQLRSEIDHELDPAIRKLIPIMKQAKPMAGDLQAKLKAVKENINTNKIALLTALVQERKHLEKQLQVPGISTRERVTLEKQLAANIKKYDDICQNLPFMKQKLANTVTYHQNLDDPNNPENQNNPAHSFVHGYAGAATQWTQEYRIWWYKNEVLPLGKEKIGDTLKALREPEGRFERLFSPLKEIEHGLRKDIKHTKDPVLKAELQTLEHLVLMEKQLRKLKQKAASLRSHQSESGSGRKYAAAAQAAEDLHTELRYHHLRYIKGYIKLDEYKKVAEQAIAKKAALINDPTRSLTKAWLDDKPTDTAYIPAAPSSSGKTTKSMQIVNSFREQLSSLKDFESDAPKPAP